MKNGKRRITEGIEQPNQERFRTLGVKKNNQYLRILEADNIKQAEIKVRNTKKSFSDEREITKSSFAAEILSKGYALRLLFL